MAELEPDDVDFILNCPSTPESLFGCAAEVVQPCIFSKDRRGGFKNVFLIGADCISRYVDWKDRKTCVLFGDAASAILVQACDIEEDGLFGFNMHTDGDGSRLPFTLTPTILSSCRGRNQKIYRIPNDDEYGDDEDGNDEDGNDNNKLSSLSDDE
ncbi:3-oxoacyl-[acyl-carrier-protein] synthase 3 A, chloroplastic [Tanacetum coccineum]